MDLKKIVRENIYNLTPYSCARTEFSGKASVWIDPNESPYNNPYNRYPDPLQMELKRRIGQMRGVVADQIFLGVGSDECIDMVYRVFCRPGIDNVVAIEPTYGMYEVCAEVNDVEYRRAPLADDFSIDIQKIFEQIDDKTKVIWICSPNNPTGNAFPRDAIEAVCAGFNGIVVVDEAYVDGVGKCGCAARSGFRVTGNHRHFQQGQVPVQHQPAHTAVCHAHARPPRGGARMGDHNSG